MEMTWLEFTLRTEGYYRKVKKEWYHTRFIGYHSLVSTGAIDTRKISINKFLPLDSDAKPKGVSDAAKEAFEKAQEQYLKEKNGS